MHHNLKLNIMNKQFPNQKCLQSRIYIYMYYKPVVLYRYVCLHMQNFLVCQLLYLSLLQLVTITITMKMNGFCHSLTKKAMQIKATQQLKLQNKTIISSSKHIVLVIPRISYKLINAHFNEQLSYSKDIKRRIKY